MNSTDHQTIEKQLNSALPTLRKGGLKSPMAVSMNDANGKPVGVAVHQQGDWTIFPETTGAIDWPVTYRFRDCEACGMVWSHEQTDS